MQNHKHSCQQLAIGAPSMTFANGDVDVEENDKEEGHNESSSEVMM